MTATALRPDCPTEKRVEKCLSLYESFSSPLSFTIICSLQSWKRQPAALYTLIHHKQHSMIVGTRNTKRKKTFSSHLMCFGVLLSFVDVVLFYESYKKLLSVSCSRLFCWESKAILGEVNGTYRSWIKWKAAYINQRERVPFSPFSIFFPFSFPPPPQALSLLSSKPLDTSTHFLSKLWSWLTYTFFLFYVSFARIFHQLWSYTGGESPSSTPPHFLFFLLYIIFLYLFFPNQSTFWFIKVSKHHKHVLIKNKPAWKAWSRSIPRRLTFVD